MLLGWFIWLGHFNEVLYTVHNASIGLLSDSISFPREEVFLCAYNCIDCASIASSERRGKIRGGVGDESIKSIINLKFPSMPTLNRSCSQYLGRPNLKQSTWRECYPVPVLPVFHQTFLFIVLSRHSHLISVLALRIGTQFFNSVPVAHLIGNHKFQT